MRGVDAHRIQDGLALASLPHLGGERRHTGLARRIDAVKTIRQPIVRAVVKHDHRWEDVTLQHILGVGIDDRLVQLRPRLRAAIRPDLPQRDYRCHLVGVRWLPVVHPTHGGQGSQRILVPEFLLPIAGHASIPRFRNSRTICRYTILNSRYATDRRDETPKA